MNEPLTEPPPEAMAIKRARTRQHLSIRKAADLAGMSEGRWRQIEAGYQTVRAGERSPVMAPAPTLARMAFVLGLTEDDLVDADRHDAVSELELVIGAAEGDTKAASRLRHPSREGVVESNDVPGLITKVVRELTNDGQLRVFEFSASVLREERSTNAVDTSAQSGASSAEYIEKSRAASGRDNDVTLKEENQGVGDDEKQSDYDLAQRKGDGPSQGRRIREQHDRDAEAGDDPGPEDGA